jgi:hypothetical protein
LAVRAKDHAIRLAVLEERSRGDRRSLRVRTKYLEWRLKNLNGEAARLKAAAELSVTREKFDDFVDTQRLAFDVYKSDMEKRMSAINIKLASWGGALIVVVAVVQYALRQT